MRARYQIWLLLAGMFYISLSLVSSVSAQQDNGSELPERVIRVGVRVDAKPFSYLHESRRNSEILTGYQGYMIEVCRRVLQEMKDQSRYRRFDVIAVEVEAETRFDALETGVVDILCGPDSITTDRLKKYRVSLPLFLSGMTYGYLNPMSHEFPSSEYCGHVVGVVVGTTADQIGLRNLSDEDLLLRFDEALDLYVDLDSKRYKMLAELESGKKKDLEKRVKVVREGLTRPGVEDILSKQFSEEHREFVECNFVDDNGFYVEEKMEGVRNDDYYDKQVQAELGLEMITDECPRGFTRGLPVRKFRSHDEGIRDFCAGKVLYYLGDYDILHAKIKEHAACDVTFNRFTRNREVYAVYFRATDAISVKTRCNPLGQDSDGLASPGFWFNRAGASAELYADFNMTLLRMMQADENLLGEVYNTEFHGQKMSIDLQNFFDSFRVAADLKSER